MSIERTINLKTTSENAVMALNYQADYVDHSFDHAFGREVQRQYEITRWELTISKFTLTWKSVTLDCLEVPEPLYDTLNKLCEEHLNNNPITKD